MQGGAAGSTASADATTPSGGAASDASDGFPFDVDEAGPSSDAPTGGSSGSDAAHDVPLTDSDADGGASEIQGRYLLLLVNQAESTDPGAADLYLTRVLPGALDDPQKASQEPVGRFAWSPSGKHFALEYPASVGGIAVRTVDPELGPATLSIGNSEPTWLCGWPHAGAALALCSRGAAQDRITLWPMPPDLPDRWAVSVVTAAPLEQRSLEWSPDGRRALLPQGGHGDDVPATVVDVRSEPTLAAELREVPDSRGRVGPCAWSPNGVWLACTNGRLVVSDMAASPPWSVVLSDRVPGSNSEAQLCWLDAWRLAFITVDREIRIADLRRQRPEETTLVGTAPGSNSWNTNPGAAWIAFRGPCAGGAEALCIGDGTRQWRVADGYLLGSQQAMSPDGSRVLYVVPEGSAWAPNHLWRAALDHPGPGGNVLMSQASLDAAFWAPDSRHVLFREHDLVDGAFGSSRLVFWDETRTAWQIAMGADQIVDRLGWSPDSQSYVLRVLGPESGWFVHELRPDGALERLKAALPPVYVDDRDSTFAWQPDPPPARSCQTDADTWCEGSLLHTCGSQGQSVLDCAGEWPKTVNSTVPGYCFEKPGVAGCGVRDGDPCFTLLGDEPLTLPCVGPDSGCVAAEPLPVCVAGVGVCEGDSSAHQCLGNYWMYYCHRATPDVRDCSEAAPSGQCGVTDGRGHCGNLPVGAPCDADAEGLGGRGSYPGYRCAPGLVCAPVEEASSEYQCRTR